MTYSYDSGALFCKNDLHSWLRNRESSIIQDIETLSGKQLEELTEKDLTQHFVDKHSLEQLVIYEDSMNAEESEGSKDVMDFGRSISVPSLMITLRIPYTGLYELWNMRPSTYRSVAPRADITPPRGSSHGEVVIIINKTINEDASQFKSEIEKSLESLRFSIGNVNQDINAHNIKLRGIAQETITARKSRLEKHNSILSQLDLPIKPKVDAPSFTPINVKKIITPLPPLSHKPQQQEYGITADNYEYILKAIRHSGRAWEKTPKTYAPHGEEDLRDFLLSNLNTHFEGDATGEAFRRSGKTDICINEQDRAAFVAECKIWAGEKSLGEAVTQLLGYLTWRDCKTSLIIINKKVTGFSDILDKIPEYLKKHKKYKRILFDQKNDGEWRYIFQSLEDEQRDIVVHIYAFNLYVA